MKPIAGLAFLACSLYAAELEGPMLGYVNSSAGVRRVLGIVGSARLTKPLTGELQGAAILPGSDAVIAKNPTGALVRVNLKDGSLAAIGIGGVAEFVVSPGGRTVLASAGGRLHVASVAGEAMGDYPSPGTPRLMAISDEGNTLAVSVAEAEGEALYRVGREGARRILQAARIAAYTFVPGLNDLIVATSEGDIYRLKSDLQLERMGTVAGTTALGSTPEGGIIAVAGKSVIAIPADGSPSSQVECSCEATIARPLGNSKFLLTNSENGPLWIVDASAAQLRLAFIPEAVNE